MVEHTMKSMKKKSCNAEVLNFEERLLSPKEWIFSGKEQKRKREISDINLQLAEQEYRKAWCYSFSIIVSSALFFLIIFSFYFGTTLFYKAISLNLTAISLICLYSGIYTPILEICAFNDDLVVPLNVEIKKVPLLNSIPWFRDQEIGLTKKFEGRMYYFYQSKSIAEIIRLLFKDGNIVVGSSILCFSVFIPVFKVFISLTILFSKRVRNVNWLITTVGIMGKWSMADVFFVASFLSYLSFSNMNPGVDTEAKTMIGLYYFFAFVILSITTTILINHAIKKDHSE